MRWLLFLSRLAFICGFCFLLSLSLLFKDWLKDGSQVSTIITIGFFMGIIIVPATLICYGVTFLIKRSNLKIIPRWLIIANIFFLFVFLAYMIYNNSMNSPYDPHYH